MEERNLKEHCLRNLDTYWEEWGPIHYYCIVTSPNMDTEEDIDAARLAVFNWFRKKGATFTEATNSDGDPIFLHIRYPKGG